MLKFLNVNPPLSSFLNRKCAEIYCQTLEHFSIVCEFCELKLFDFNDFLLHFRNVHLEHCKQYDEDGIKQEAVVAAKAVDLDDCQDRKELPLESVGIDVTQKFMPAIVNENITSSDEDHEFSGGEVISDSVGENADSGEKSEYMPKILKTKAAALRCKCGDCGKICKNVRSLERHASKCLSMSRIYRCTQCDSEFQNENNLRLHVKGVHEGYPCHQCDKVYKSKDALQLHAFNHSGVRSFVCDIGNCGKAFFNRKYLCRHKREVHTLERNYICEMCGFRTKGKAALVVHKRSHTGEKPYPCNLCDKRFASPSLLAVHKPIHSSERPHECDVCGATFARLNTLYHHKHLHSGVKKFKCKICGNAYAQAAGLAGHMRKHKPEH